MENKINSRKIVEVEWIDAHSSLDCITVSELINEKPYLTQSVGYLMLEDKEKVILSFMNFGFNINEEPLMKHYQIIPRGMIKKIKIIKEGVEIGE